MGVITGPRPGGPTDGRGGVDGGKDRGLEPVRGNCFVWVRFDGCSEVTDDTPRVDGRGSEGSWDFELNGCGLAALAASAITVFISILDDN